jgi:DNA-binding PadR family transcriptional regulator
MLEAAKIAGNRGWMRGTATPMRGALLGLLMERPGQGGELAHRLVVRMGETWRIESKSVYRLLEQLEEEGLACSRVEPRRGSERRMRVVYHPTEETAEALTIWMETLLPREPVRLSVQAKLAVAREQDVEPLLDTLRAYERECLMLAALVCTTDTDMHSWSTLLVDCTRDSVRGVLAAEIDWARRSRLRLEEYQSRVLSVD